MMMNKQHGFTLLELAVVLVIIAFLIGGIIVGRDLIRASELNAVASEVAHYTQAIADFREKYYALPGDFTGATALWGSADGVIPSDAACETTVGTGTKTCDGNGDGRIGCNTVTSVCQYERFRAWQHLANAGMIDGNFSGVAGALNPYNAIIGTNVPASKLAGAGYAIFSVVNPTEAGTPPYFSNYFANVNYGHVLQFGANTGLLYAESFLPSMDAWALAVRIESGTTMAPVLTTAEALSLDQKMDDGLPGSGKIMAFQKDSPVTPNCTTSDIASSARYDATQSGVKCSLVFLMGF